MIVYNPRLKENKNGFTSQDFDKRGIIICFSFLTKRMTSDGKSLFKSFNTFELTEMEGKYGFVQDTFCNKIIFNKAKYKQYFTGEIEGRTKKKHYKKLMEVHHHGPLKQK